MQFDQLQEGMRYRFKDADRPVTFTLTRKYWAEDEYAYSPYSHISSEDLLRVELTPENGGTKQTYDGWKIHQLVEGLIYHPKSGFKIGDTMEIAREGLEPNLRGRLLEIDESAEMWPYRVGHTETGASVWFAWHELTKIHSIISAQRSGKAKEVLKKQIAEARAELEALETALEILEYAS